MKTSYIIGLVTLWLIIFMLVTVVENTTTVDGETVSMLDNLFKPKGTNFSNVVSGISSLVTDVWQYMTLIIKLTFLWFPSMWTGVYIWFWYLICLPLGIGIVWSIVTILRGVGSS